MTSYFTFYLMEKFNVTMQQSQFCLFAYLAAFAAGTLLGGFLGDRYGRKYVILFPFSGLRRLRWQCPISICFGRLPPPLPPD